MSPDLKHINNITQCSLNSVQVKPDHCVCIGLCACFCCLALHIALLVVNMICQELLFRSVWSSLFFLGINRSFRHLFTLQLVSFFKVQRFCLGTFVYKAHLCVYGGNGGSLSQSHGLQYPCLWIWIQMESTLKNNNKQTKTKETRYIYSFYLEMTANVQVQTLSMCLHTKEEQTCCGRIAHLGGYYYCCCWQ